MRLHSSTKMSLKEFIVSCDSALLNRSAYVREPGFSYLYVRYGKRWINEKMHDNFLDIANVEARQKGKGTFSRFIEQLRKDYPTMGIYVECVQNHRLHKTLEKLGFKNVEGGGLPPSFYWMPEKQKG